MILTKYHQIYLIFIIHIIKWYVSCEDLSAKRQQLIAAVQIAEQLDNGYIDKGIEEEDVIDVHEASMSQLRQALIIKYEHLKCGYLYIAQTHVFVTKAVILETNKNALRYISIDDFSFSLEISSIIAVMIDLTGVRLDEFWLVHIYADKLQSYIDDIKCNKSFPAYQEFRDSMWKLYNFVVEYLDEYLILNCRHNNHFNMNIDDCLHGQQPTQNLIPVIKNTHCLPLAAKIIKNNKQALGLTMLHNLNVGLAAYNSAMIRDEDYLSKVLSCKRLASTGYISAFGKYFEKTEWDNIQYRFSISKYPIIREELKQITFERTLYLMMIAIHKIGMLQLTWKFIAEIYNLISESATDESAIGRYISDWHLILTQFKNALYLSHDDFFEELCTLFNLTNCLINIDSVIEKIKHEHDSIAASIGTSPMSRMMSNYSTDDPSSNKINDHFTDAQRIVSEIVNKTSENLVDFKLIQSLMTFLDDIDKRLQLAASNYKRTNTRLNVYNVNLSF